MRKLLERWDKEAYQAVAARYASFVIFSVLFSVVPYIGLWAVWSASPTPPSNIAVRLTGSGQLMLTSIALVGGGLREILMFARSDRLISRILYGGASAGFIVLVSMIYGSIAQEVVRSPGAVLPLAAQESNVTWSLRYLASAVVLSAFTLWSTRPLAGRKKLAADIEFVTEHLRKEANRASGVPQSQKGGSNG